MGNIELATAVLLTGSVLILTKVNTQIHFHPEKE